MSYLTYHLLLGTWFAFAVIFVMGVATGDQSKSGRQFVLAILWPVVLAAMLIGLIAVILTPHDGVDRGDGQS